MAEAPQENAAGARLLTPTVVASALVAVGGIFVGVVVLAGWLYTRAYYRQFGIEPSTLSFSPYEYALRTKLAFASSLMVAVSFLLGLSLSWSLSWKDWIESIGSRRQRVTTTIVSLLLIACAFGVALIDWFTRRSGLYIWCLVLGLGAWSVLVAEWFMQREDLSLFGLVSLIAVVAVLLLYIPGAQGETDGNKDRDHLDKFPAVSLVAAQALGIPHDEFDGTFHRYGPYRLVLRNNGMYYLVAAQESNETMAVPEGSITYVQIHND